MKPKNIFIGIVAVIAAVLGLDTHTGRAASRTLSRFWNAGSKWLKWGIGIVAFWPIPMVFAALTPDTAIKAIVALLPLIGIAIILFTIFDPMVIGVIGGFSAGRRFLGRLIGIVAFELVIGIYLAIFPLSNDKGLVPLALLLLVSIPFILFGMTGKARRWLLTLVVIAIIGIAVIVSLGGRKEAKKQVHDFFHSSSPIQSQPAVEQFSLPYSDELKKEGKVQEETPTVEASPGTRHRLWANKPYMAISVQMDGSRNLYNMPAGWESWIGAEPAGRLRLIAKEEGTIVKISSWR